MGSLLLTDYAAVDRDVDTLHRGVAHTLQAMRQYCGDDADLFTKARRALESGNFDRQGNLRRVAQASQVLGNVTEILPIIKTLELHRKKTFLHNFTIESLGQKRDECRAFVLESRCRRALENMYHVVAGEEILPLTFERVLDNEQKRRASFLEACSDMVRHDRPGEPFDAKQLHIGAGLAHHRLLTNQPILLPHFATQGSPVDGARAPWHLTLLDDRIAGYNVGFGFAVKKLQTASEMLPRRAVSPASTSADRDCWIPAVSIDVEVYEALMRLRAKEGKDRTVVTDTLGAVQKYFMMACHDSLHHSMYSMKRDGWDTFEGSKTPYQKAGRPRAVEKHVDEYKRIPKSYSSTHHEFFAFVMHRRIMRHLFNSDTIDGKDNVRGRAMKEALIASGERFAADLASLRDRLESMDGVGAEKANKMTEYLATLGLSQLAMTIDMDDKDMKRVYQAFETHHIFTPYTLPVESFLSRLHYASGQYQVVGDHHVVTRADLEKIKPDMQSAYLVNTLRECVAGLQPDQSIVDARVSGEAGIKARILSSPWGGMCGWLNEQELGKDWCPAIASTYYKAFMTPELVRSAPFEEAAAKFSRVTGSNIDFSTQSRG